MSAYYNPKEIINIYPLDIVKGAAKGNKASGTGPQVEGEPAWVKVFREAGLDPQGPKVTDNGTLYEMLCPRDRAHSTPGHREAMFATFWPDNELRHINCRHDHCGDFAPDDWVGLFSANGFKNPGFKNPMPVEIQAETVPEDNDMDLWHGIPVEDLVENFMDPQDTGPAQKRLQVRTWKDIQHKVIPPISWLCEPLFPNIAFGIVAGQPGHGKSYIILQLAVAKATGLPFMGFPVDNPGGVGVLTLEDDENTTNARIQSIIRGYGDSFTPEHHRLVDVNLRIIERAPMELVSLTPEAMDMTLSGLAEELGEAMKTTEAKPALLVIDTLNAVNDGDENDATETRRLVATIYALHQSLGCSVWVLHHYRKAGLGKSAPSVYDRMDPEIIRGSSAIVGSVRGVFQMAWVTKGEAQKAGLVDWTDPHQYAIVGLTKHNGGPKSKWELWKHGEDGVLVPVPNSDRVLALIRGGDAVQNLDIQDQVLVAIHRAAVAGVEFDRKEVAQNLFAATPDPAGSLRSHLGNLRKGKLITKTDTLTPSGFSKAQTIASAGVSGDQESGGEAA